MFVHEKEREAERKRESESGGESGCHQQAPQPAEVRGHHVWKGRPRSNSLPVPHALGVLGIAAAAEEGRREAPERADDEGAAADGAGMVAKAAGGSAASASSSSSPSKRGSTTSTATSAAGHVNVSQGAGGPKLLPEDGLLDLHDALQANKHAKTHRGEKRGLKQEDERVDYEAGKDEEDRHSH